MLHPGWVNMTDPENSPLLDYPGWMSDAMDSVTARLQNSAAMHARQQGMTDEEIAQRSYGPGVNPYSVPYNPMIAQQQEPPPQYTGNPYRQAPPVQAQTRERRQPRRPGPQQPQREEVHRMHQGIAPSMRVPIYDPREGRLWR